VIKGGALAAGEIRPSNPYNEEHRWYTIDPIEVWFDSLPRSPLFSR
jgi:hypothetical protein